MRKLLLVLIIFSGSIKLANAQFPIPSFNAIVDNRATFTEQQQTVKSPLNIDAKRFLKINRKPTKTPLSDVYFYAGTLDGQTTLGPFYIEPGQTISIEIDNREWGIVVFAESEVILDVWITEENPPGGGEE